MATTVRLLQNYTLSGVPYKAGDLVSIDSTLATQLSAAKVTDSAAAAITQATTEGKVIKYPDVDALTYQKTASKKNDIDNFLNLADIPTGFTGTAQVGTQLYVGDGVSLIPQTPIISRIRSIRPKLAVFGNSITTRSIMGETFANSWSAWGHVPWIHAFTNAGFDRCRSAAFSWGAQGNSGGSESIDAYGCYGWGGATNSLSGAYSLLNHLPVVLTKLIDTPDIVYLANMFENDIGISIATATIIRDGQKTLDLVMSKFPNALIIVSCPNPSTSYTTAAQHSTFVSVSSWLKTLPVLYPNVLIENNTATTVQSGTLDQPILRYTSDNIIHPNEKGAIVRARAFYQQFGYLFPNALDVPFLAYNSANAKQTFQTNPDFFLTGSAGGAVNGTIYNSYDWYADTNVVPNVTPASNGGVILTPTVTGAVAVGNGAGATSDAQSVTVLPSNYYYSAVKVQVINPTNLAGFVNTVQFAGGSAESHKNMGYQTAFFASYPEGISDVLVAGDTFTFVTPSLPPGNTNNSISYTQTKLMLTAAIPTGAATSANPSVQIKVQNVLTDKAIGPQDVTIATTTSYANDTISPQQLVITGTATFTVLTLTRGAVVVNLPLSNGIVTLSPGDSITPTYATGTPVFTIIQQ